MTTVAVMQPYFMPYLGYFRLLARAEIFVAYDCVQFARRGWVHRNRLHNATGSPAWLTLPVRRAARSILIRDLMFDDRADTWWPAAVRRFSGLLGSAAGRASELTGVPRTDASVTDYLVPQLGRVASALNITTPIRRSSAFLELLIGHGGPALAAELTKQR